MTTRTQSPRAGGQKVRVPHDGMLQRFGEMTANPINLRQQDAKRIVDLLNPHLASEYVLYHQYKKHHWVVQGAQFMSLHLLLDEHAEGVREIADDIAERVTYLGALPVSRPSKMEEFAYIQHEEEGRFGVRPMLEHDLHCNQVILSRMREHVGIARQIGDHGTAHCLERWIVRHEKWAHELDNYLQHETLCDFLVTR